MPWKCRLNEVLLPILSDFMHTPVRVKNKKMTLKKKLPIQWSEEGWNFIYSSSWHVKPQKASPAAYVSPAHCVMALATLGDPLEDPLLVHTHSHPTKEMERRIVKETIVRNLSNQAHFIFTKSELILSCLILEKKTIKQYNWVGFIQVLRFSPTNIKIC